MTRNQPRGEEVCITTAEAGHASLNLQTLSTQYIRYEEQISIHTPCGDST
jgi:hypothetical protein